MQPAGELARFSLYEKSKKQVKAGEYVGNRCLLQCSRSHIHFFISLCCCLLLLAACGSQAMTTTATGTTTPTTRQTLVFPNVGIQDLDSLDPTQAQDANALLALNMIYSGLVRLDQQLNVIP